MPGPSPTAVLVEEEVAVGPLRASILRPRSAEDLIDEADFARDERLPYWAELWPSGRVLAAELAARPPAGRAVVELGCGLAVPSMVALLAGAARVLATDWYREALDLAGANARRATGRDLPTMLVDWREPPAALLAAAPFDLVVAADVLYEERNAHALAALLPQLASPRGEVWIADPRRPDAALLMEALTVAGWSHERHDRPVPGRVDEAGPVVHLHVLRPPFG